MRAKPGLLLRPPVFGPTTKRGQVIVNPVAQDLSSDVTFTRASIGTYFNSAGILQTAAINAPRFGSLDGGANLGLVLESARTNLLVSSSINSGFSTNSSATVSANSLVSPDGTTNAEQLTTAATTVSGVFKSVDITGLTAATAYTLSVFIKYISGSNASVKIGSDASGGAPFWTSGSSFMATFNAQTGVLSSIGADITASSVKTLPNGWFRVVLTGTTIASQTKSQFIIYNASASLSGVFGVWGLQFEAGLFETSLIETTGSTVTRSADVAHITSLLTKPWFNSAEGTIVAKVRTTYAAIGFQRAFQIGDVGGSANRITVWAQSTTSNVRSSLTDNSVDQAGVEPGPTTWAANTNLNTALAYKVNDFSSSVNGSAVAVDTSCTIPSASLTTFSLGMTGASGSVLNGILMSLTYYPKRLPDANLVRFSV